MENIIVINNIEVEISKIYQQKTYYTLIEGTPGEELNDTILAEIKEQAKSIFNRDSFYVMDPRENTDDNFPQYTIILELMVLNDLEDYSPLTVIFFQDKYAFPITAENIESIKEIPIGLLWSDNNLNSRKHLQ